jgi:predicted small integral membrane protein
VAYRIANIGQSTGFIFPLALFMLDRRDRVWKLAFYATIIMFGLGFLIASKSALMTPILILIIACHLARGYIPKKFIRWGVVAFLVTIFVFAPMITAVRSLLINWTLSGEVGAVAFDSTKAFLKMSFRLGGLDWLAGFMTVGRESFPWWVSGYGEVIELVNTLVPGELIPIEGWVSVAHIIPHLTRGLSLEALSVGGHGELLGGVGMAFVYYGFWGGPLFFVVWSAITTVVLVSRIHVLFKGLYLYYFVIVFLLGGGFLTAGKTLMEAAIVLTIITSYYVVIVRKRSIITPRGGVAKCETGAGT